MMSEALRKPVSDDIPIPDVTNLTTEDDTPVDNLFSEKQMRLLTEPLFSCWKGPPDGTPFFLAANVGVFPTATDDSFVPDVFLSFDTSPKQPMSEKKNRSYFVWEHGKPPDVVIEIVSNKEGGELSRKVRGYERMRVTHYVVFDPWRQLTDALLTRFAMQEGMLVQQEGPLWLARAGIGLTLWEGEYEKEHAHWLRWCTAGDVVVPTGAERADAETQRADAETQRAERLAERLRALGIDPDS